MCCLLQSYAVDSILEGADMTNAVVDRVDFSNAKLKGAKFINAVVTGRGGHTHTAAQQTLGSTAAGDL
jgi:uncharacterized protein YjbI with pentapeptide repeats